MYFVKEGMSSEISHTVYQDAHHCQTSHQFLSLSYIGLNRNSTRNFSHSCLPLR